MNEVTNRNSDGRLIVEFGGGERDTAPLRSSIDIARGEVIEACGGMLSEDWAIVRQTE